MIEIYLFIEGQYVGQRNLAVGSTAGRKLEPAGTYEVTRTVWHEKGTGLAANVHLKQIGAIEN